MAKTSEIVNIINANLISRQFNFKQFQKGSIKGLAEKIITEQGAEIGIIATNGDVDKVSLNDTFPFQLYHRITAIGGIRPVGEDGFGEIDTVSETTSLKLVVMFDRSKLNFTFDQIITAINSGWTPELTKAQLSTNDLTDCQIELGSWNIDKYSVYQEEYDQAFQLPTTTNLISFDYQITTVFNKTCITLC